MFHALLVAVTLLALSLPAMADSKTSAQKNVVLIVADDLGLMLGCYGDPNAKTPNLDRLAQEILFTRAHCTTASCSASRSVMLTGLYNHANAHYGHEHGYNHFRTYETVRSLPVMLAEAGYRTCSIGKYHLAPESVYHFESYANGGVSQAPGNPGKSEGPMRMAENARRFMAEPDPRPFFLYFCTHEPHRAGKGFNNEKPSSGITPVKYDPAQVKLPNWLPDRPEVRLEWAEYLQAISRMDQAVGGVLKGLEATGHAGDTLVLFISDNGPPFPGAKTTLYQPGMNLPLIVRNPAQSTRGLVTDAMVTWADLTPTILDYAGVNSSAGKSGKAPQAKNQPGSPPIQGRSFLAVLDQEHPQGWDEIYLSHTFHEITNYYPMRAIISGQYKYILNVAHQLPFPFASDLYASSTWQGVLEQQGHDHRPRKVQDYLQRPRDELYDLAVDPGELHNLAADPQHAERLAALQARLKTWQQQTGDPWVHKWEYE